MIGLADRTGPAEHAERPPTGPEDLKAGMGSNCTGASSSGS